MRAFFAIIGIYMHLLLIFMSSIVLSSALTYALISFFKHFKIGQSIREEGPQSHISKAGTPTMGGLAILTSITIISLIFFDLDGKLIALLLVMIGFGLIGLFDDLIKVTSNNNLGLLPWQKMALQIAVGLLFGAYLIFCWHETSVTGILKVLHFNLSWLYLPLIAFLMVGFANATNLTDGLDGLLAGCLIAAFASFAVIASKVFYPDVLGLCIVSIGAIGGFLIFNYHPAKIFMGDAGSLALGALLCGISIILHKEIIFILIGGIFVAEVLSVMIQVAFFKKTGKRFFKMSPLHHHFELSGIKETKLVIGFWIVASILGIIGILIR